MSKLLVCQDITRTYQLEKTLVPVLKGVSLAVDEGETLSITGASGSGKSTLLHALGALEKPDQGTVTFRGEDVYSSSNRRMCHLRANEIGFVFQQYHLLPELTVLENVVIASMAIGKRNVERATELLASVGLSDRLAHRPTELSGGEQQRVGIARALMNKPSLILADEPTGNLDSKTGAGVLDQLFELAEKEKLTLIIVTHNEDVAARCSRGAFLLDGRIQDTV